MEKSINTVSIVGPTASGKTKLSVELAKHFNGEIVSADSMQIYRYMDIGTAKVTPEEADGVPHYLIDELNPEECRLQQPNLPKKRWTEFLII